MSKKEERIPVGSAETAKGRPLEDRALKEAARLFGEELMPLLGIKEKVCRMAPTEQVYLNPKDFMEDFNYEMMDGSWRHLEFESDSIRIGDLRRFRTYEAVMSQNYEVDVTTCVICTANTKKITNRLVTGISTYRIKVVRMRDRDAERVINRLEQKQKNRELNRQDLLMVLLTPLMGGGITQRERIERSFILLKNERENANREEMAQMEAVLYTFAMKFLKKPELIKLKEMMNMTILGEMIMQDGIKKGRTQGEEMMLELVQKLTEAQRPDEISRIREDKEYRQILYRKYGIQE